MRALVGDTYLACWLSLRDREFGLVLGRLNVGVYVNAEWVNADTGKVNRERDLFAIKSVVESREEYRCHLRDLHADAAQDLTHVRLPGEGLEGPLLARLLAARLKLRAYDERVWGEGPPGPMVKTGRLTLVSLRGHWRERLVKGLGVRPAEQFGPEEIAPPSWQRTADNEAESDSPSAAEGAA